MINVSKDTLYEMYVIRGKPMHEISSDLKISIGSVYNYLKKYEIPIKTKSEAFAKLKEKGWEYPESAREAISRKHTGRIVSEETKQKMSKAKKQGGIGHKKVRSDGYVAVYFPDHPKSSKDGYVMEHDLVMECLIGRYLRDDEVVHHINFRRSDNRKENLKLMTFKEHAGYHMTLRHKLKKGGKTHE